MNKCTATTNAGQPCKAWAIRGTDLCSAHSGKVGAPAGNTNRQTHGFYTRALTAQEVADLITHAQNMTLDDEIGITRVLLRRLLIFLQADNPLSVSQVAAIAPLVFSGARTVAYLMRHMSDSAGPLWDEILDEMSIELGMDI